MNSSPLHLHVPEPTGRPGKVTDFSYLHISQPPKLVSRAFSSWAREYRGVRLKDKVISS